MRCSRCRTEKESADFYCDSFRSSGFSSRCKPCAIKASTARQKNDPLRRGYMRRYYEEHCGEAKAYGRLRYEVDKEKIAENTARWRKANPTKVAGYSKTYRVKNPVKRAALVAKYRASAQRQAPPWLTRAHYAEIEGVYHFAKVMEQITGQKHHVDHIEPLQSQEVSGLHVPWNLRAISARENAAKGNRRAIHVDH